MIILNLKSRMQKSKSGWPLFLRALRSSPGHVSESAESGRHGQVDGVLVALLHRLTGSHARRTRRARRCVLLVARRETVVFAARHWRQRRQFFDQFIPAIEYRNMCIFPHGHRNRIQLTCSLARAPHKIGMRASAPNQCTVLCMARA